MSPNSSPTSLLLSIYGSRGTQGLWRLNRHWIENRKTILRWKHENQLGLTTKIKQLIKMQEGSTIAMPHRIKHLWNEKKKKCKKYSPSVQWKSRTGLPRQPFKLNYTLERRDLAWDQVHLRVRHTCDISQDGEDDVSWDRDLLDR